MGTAERRIEIMKYLCRARYSTMLELSRQFGVSERTIQRDILELMFIMPLEVRTGRYYGGIYVVGDYTFERMYMSGVEIEVLHKIKEFIDTEEKIVLSSQEKTIFYVIIKNYTRPVHKKTS